MPKWIKTLWAFISHLSQAWQLWVWLAPAGAMSVITGVFASAVGLSAFEIWMATVATFCIISVTVAAIFHGLLRYNEWRYRTDDEGKLDFIGTYCNVGPIWGANGKARYIEGVNLGVNLRNLAQFPIEFEFVSFQAVLDGRIAPVSDFFYRRVAPPAGVVGSHPGAILIGDLKILQVKGTVEFELHYGKVGSGLRHTIKKRQTIDIRVDKAASIRPNLKLAIAVRDPL